MLWPYLIKIGWCITGLVWTGLVLPHSWGSKAKASDTFARHAVLSCAVLTQSATGSSVQSLMSSVQRLRGLPCFLVPAIRPWRMEVQRLSALTTCPKYRSFLRCISFSSRALVSSSSRMDWLVLWSFQLILNILLYAVISNPAILFLSLAFNVHDSHP